MIWIFWNEFLQFFKCHENIFNLKKRVCSLILSLAHDPEIKRQFHYGKLLHKASSWKPPSLPLLTIAQCSKVFFWLDSDNSLSPSIIYCLTLPSNCCPRPRKQENAVFKTRALVLDRYEFKSWLHYLVAVWPRLSSSTSLSLSVHLCKWRQQILSYSGVAIIKGESK